MNQPTEKEPLKPVPGAYGASGAVRAPYEAPSVTRFVLDAVVRGGLSGAADYISGSGVNPLG